MDWLDYWFLPWGLYGALPARILVGVALAILAIALIASRTRRPVR